MTPRPAFTALLTVVLLVAGGLPVRTSAQARRSFTLDQLLSFPFPENLVAAQTGSRIAWTLNVRGARNVYVAEGPAFAPSQLTHYEGDDGQELTGLAFSSDGRYLVYVRGGNHAAHRSWGEAPNPAGSVVAPRVQVWSIATSGGESRLLGEGDAPAVAPQNGRVAFVKDGRIWLTPIDGSTAAVLIPDEGVSAALAWSPDGSMLAFESNHDGHESIAILASSTQAVRYLAGTSTDRDSAPAWSPDGGRVAFVREPVDRTSVARPWSICVAAVTGGPARQIWKSGEAPADSPPPTPDPAKLLWGAGNRVVFLSYHDKWPHLYSVSASGGAARLLTPGPFMVEDVALAPDRRSVLYNANSGRAPGDGDRRHAFRVPVDVGPPVQLTSGNGIEWSPSVTGDGKTLAYLASDAIRPPEPRILPLAGGPGGPRGGRAIGTALADFPASDLVRPEPVVLHSAGGVTVHAQLFGANASGPRPAVVFLHGGPAQQMLLGWHYNDYYAHAYALNQYLASRGFVVLSVNYRLGIGYGYAFQFPDGAVSKGPSEYDDVIAAAKYLQTRPDVDRRRIGVWGLSYGGYLTALALGRASDLFSAGVDVHGIHDAVMPLVEGAPGTTSEDAGARFPWRSPVLLIHADDDRNVPFGDTVDFERTLISKGVPVESFVIPDDVHDFLLFRTWKSVATAAAEFFERTLVAPQPGAPQ